MGSQAATIQRPIQKIGVETTVPEEKTEITTQPATPTPVIDSAWNEEIKSSLPEPALSANGATVLASRYLKKDAITGEPTETARDLFWRVASSVAQPESETGKKTYELWARRFYDMMATGQFMPNSPTIMNAGREMGMLSACFVLPVEDSIESIFGTLKHVALIQKAGGGTGFSFSRLRPDGDIVSTSGGQTSGPMAFIDVYSAGTDAIQQGAFRRGANMGVLRCDHPDIVEFVGAKTDLNRWTNYNVSIAVTNEWMNAATSQVGDKMVVVNPRDGRKAWLRKAEGRRISEADYDAHAAGDTGGAEYWTYGEVMDKVIQHAWSNGEPGMLFLDRANEDNQVPNLGTYEATNPCGEQWLLPYGSCNLGSINLGMFCNEDAADTGVWQDRFDWDAFDTIVADSTRFLDNVITINRYPIPEIRDRANQERRIGLGVMGFADLLYKLGIRYGSEESLEVGREISRRLTEVAYSASEELVSEDERAPFDAWEGSKPQTFGENPRRNSHVTTVAPTGTISIISDCSGGIEPLFSLAFKRQVMKDADGNPVVMTEINEAFREAMEQAGYSASEIESVVEVAMKDGTIAHSDLPVSIRDIFVTAHDVAPREHILMQAAWQSSIDNAVSKTINLPHDSTPDDVREAYQLAWREGCKGVTVYRDGCREQQPMTLATSGQSESGTPSVAALPNALYPTPLPEIMPCLRIRQMTPFGNMHCKISVDPVEGKEMEVFAQLGKGGDIVNSDLEAICRVSSLFLRSGGSMELILRQLDEIGSSYTAPTKEGRIMSLPDGLAKALQKYMHFKSKHGLEALLLGRVNPDSDTLEDDGVSATIKKKSGRLGSGQGNAVKIKCPACDNGTLVFSEGCNKCMSCGFSQC